MDSPSYRSSQPIRPRTDGWTNGAIIRTVLIIALTCGALALLWTASDVLMLIFLGVLFGLAVSRAADLLTRWRIPRALSAATVVLAVVAGLIGIGSYVAPTLVQQTGEIRTQLPAALKSGELWLNAHTNGLASTIISDQTAAAAGDSTATESVQRHQRLDVAQQVSDGLKIATRLIFGFLSSSLTVIAGVGLMFVLAIYVGAESQLYHRGILSLIPPTSRPRAAEVMAATADTLRKWLVTQLIAMVTIGAASYLVLKVIGVQAAFALALIAGVLEFIPTLGPIMSGAIAVSMAFLDSPSKALVTLIAMFVIQQLENNLLIPVLMKGKMDIPPALTLVAQALMAVIFGFAGLLVAVPFLAAVIVPIRMLYIQDTLGGPFVEKTAEGGVIARPLVHDELGKGPPLVLLHGFPLDRQLWAPQRRALAGAARIITPDLRGFGGSAALGAPPVTVDGHADDVAALLDALGIERAIVGGMSMGGYVALAFWRRHRKRVAGLLLADTRAGADTEEGKQKRRAMMETARTTGARGVADAMMPGIIGKTTRATRPEIEAELRAILDRAPVPGILAAIQAMIDRPDSTPTLATIDVPTLIVVGEEDALTPVKESEAMHAAIAGSVLEILPGAGHCANFERPAAFNHIVLEFLHAV